MKKKRSVKWLAVLMVFSLTVSLSGFTRMASAASKTPKVSTKKVTVKEKKSKTVKIKNKPSGAKVTWKSKNKKIAKVSKKGKITGVKKGKTTVVVKVKYKKKGKKKKVTKTFNIKVTVTKASTAKKTPTPTKKTPQPTATAPQKGDTSSGGDDPSQGTEPPSESGSPGPDTSTQPASPSIPTAEPSTISFKVPNDIDMTDPSVGVEDAKTVTDAEVSEDTTNKGTSRTLANGTKTTDNGMVRKKLTNQQLIRFMGQGWNLSNTLESCGIAGATTPIEFEKGWGAVETTQNIIRGVHESGFNTIRIPVAWSNMVSDDGSYTIDTAYLKRVEEVVNWCLHYEMYVIIDIHYDGDWWGQFGYNHQEVRDEAWKRYTAYWTQIANWFKEYSDRVIFESANEELGDRLNDDFINARTGEGNFIGTLTTDQCYQITNKLNQKFVEIVRKSGGNNLYRQLTIAGYNTDIDMSCDKRFVMPTDTVKANGTDKISVSVHYYTQADYCINEDRTDANYKDSWGTDADKQEMNAQFEKMQQFTGKGYGVILSEYGPQLMSKTGIPDFLQEVMTLGKKYNYAPIIWNTSMYNRTDKKFEYKDLATVFNEMTGKDMLLVEWPDSTGPVSVTTIDEPQVTKQVTWKGAWTRTNNVGVQLGADGNPVEDENGSYIPLPGEVGGYLEQSIDYIDPEDEGLTVTSNGWWWQLFLNYDWKSMKEPYIRVTMDKDAISQNADFQMGYSTQEDGGSYTLSNYSNKEYGSKIIKLDHNKLKVKPWLVFSSSSPGATITKIELFDRQ
ncbi:MAG: glycoside hydrolase family 5 protein [Lachnospiraceae bacterium]|nr:glycoside hydrolase family 5 protein [Lachnospiraceae bacterium]